MGDVVLRELLVELKRVPALGASVDVFCLIETEELRAQSLAFIQQMREAGLVVEYSLTPAKSDKQFRRAIELNARFTVRVEREAVGQIVVKIKDLRTREENGVPLDEAARWCAQKVAG
jgi:histidyl-tRNA synthetase